MAVAERQSDYYDSAYLADYYESLWTGHDAIEDIEIYWGFFKSQVLSRQQADSNFVLLDVGTGTGRVIHSLIDKVADDTELSLDTIKLIGMDKSPFMLHHAQKARQLPMDAVVSWSVGCATALEEIEPIVANGPGQVDFVLFAFSGISHLHQPGEANRFLSSARRVLRLGGLALVSVCTPLLDVEESYVENPYGKVKEVKSKRMEGILYREREMGQKIDRDIFVNSLKTEVIQVSADGNEHVLERNNHDIPLKLLTRHELAKGISEAGLRVLEEKRIRGEVIFILEAV